jgi:hypothetical protein
MNLFDRMDLVEEWRTTKLSEILDTVGFASGADVPLWEFEQAIRQAAAEDAGAFSRQRAFEGLLHHVLAGTGGG